MLSQTKNIRSGRPLAADRSPFLALVLLASLVLAQPARGLIGSGGALATSHGAATSCSCSSHAALEALDHAGEDHHADAGLHAQPGHDKGADHHSGARDQAEVGACCPSDQPSGALPRDPANGNCCCRSAPPDYPAPDPALPTQEGQDVDDSSPRGWVKLHARSSSALSVSLHVRHGAGGWYGWGGGAPPGAGQQVAGAITPSVSPWVLRTRGIAGLLSLFAAARI